MFNRVIKAETVFKMCSKCAENPQKVLLGTRWGMAERVAHILSLSKNTFFSCTKFTLSHYVRVIFVFSACSTLSKCVFCCTHFKHRSLGERAQNVLSPLRQERVVQERVAWLQHIPTVLSTCWYVAHNTFLIVYKVYGYVFCLCSPRAQCSSAS